MDEGQHLPKHACKVDQDTGSLVSRIVNILERILHNIKSDLASSQCMAFFPIFMDLSLELFSRIVVKNVVNAVADNLKRFPYFYRTQVSLGSDLWVRVSLTE